MPEKKQQDNDELRKGATSPQTENPTADAGNTAQQPDALKGNETNEVPASSDRK